MTTLTARNATPADLVAILQQQKSDKLDVVAPATKIHSRNGLLVVDGTVADLTEEGVTTAAGTYRPTDVFDDGLSAKLNIPRQYLRRMRDERPDVLDANVNGWLQGRKRHTAAGLETVYPADDRSFLLRLFRGEDGTEGVARAMLSSKYALSMDNLDILTAVMKGIQGAGVEPTVLVSDLSERHMRVRFEFPDVHTTVPEVLDGYRDPFGGGGGRVRRAGHRDLTALREQYGPHHIFNRGEEPIVYLGFDLDNSETGGGAYNLIPVANVVRCTNGWVMTERGVRRVHLGARLAEGLVKPSLETVRKAGELVASETTDAVRTWLSDGYLDELVAGVAEKAGHPISSPTEVVPAILAGLGFSEDERKGVLDMFIMSGQPTSGGVLQAVTAYAQTVGDVDRAVEIERAGIPALNAAAAA